MQIKHGVVTEGSATALWYALGAAETICLELCKKEITITSMLDGTHQPDSLHYRGLAADIRTRDLDPVTTATLYHRIKARLYQLGFDVVREQDHIHIEYDPTSINELTTSTD